MPIGIYSVPLKQIACELPHNLRSCDFNYDMTWRELSSPKTMVNPLFSSYLVVHSYKLFIFITGISVRSALKGL